MLQLSAYRPSETPKRFVPAGREVESIRIAHPVIEIYRHTLCFLVRYSTGEFFIRAACVKSSCKHYGHLHEVFFPQTEAQALEIVEKYCTKIDFTNAA